MLRKNSLVYRFIGLWLLQFEILLRAFLEYNFLSFSAYLSFGVLRLDNLDLSLFFFFSFYPIYTLHFILFSLLDISFLNVRWSILLLLCSIWHEYLDLRLMSFPLIQGSDFLQFLDITYLTFYSRFVQRFILTLILLLNLDIG